MPVNFKAVKKPSSRPDTKNGSERLSDMSDGGESLNQLNVVYNPDIVNGLLSDLEEQVDAKCALIQKDVDFMATSIQQAFHLELIKLPTQVKQMSLTRFREEFGDSLEAVTRGAMSSSNSEGSGKSSSKGGAGRRGPVGGSVLVSASSSAGNQNIYASANKPTSSQSRVFQTPSADKGRLGGGVLAETPGAVRAPREGEVCLSQNGSPLGEYQPTVVKAPRPDDKASIIPPTPGVIKLNSGASLDLDNMDVSSLGDEAKADALAQMTQMMASMQAMMAKLGSSLAANQR